jgi:pyruvate dehydrogenase E2 component (dihydrolipoamide acetyltransferase)
MSQFLMPSLGADMESAILMEWHVKEGDSVKKGQVIAEVETSKGVIEIEVFEDGVVEKLLVEEETECEVGKVLALIRTDEEGSTEPKKEIKEEPLVEEKIEVKSTEQETKTKKENTDKDERIKISPAARKKADELGVDISEITPQNGAIHLEQIQQQYSSSKKTPTKEKKKHTSNDQMRKAIAAAMSKSNTEIPHYYLSTSINMTPALNFIEELNKERNINERILPVAILIRAVVMALKDVPELNGFWQENSHQISKEIHPGIAIALRKGGLMTPALLNADVMSLDDTMNSLSDLITRTRSGKLKSSEIIAQTITITNLGDLGVESVYGVIYPPQLAVIGLGAILDKPWAEDDTLSVRKVMQATIAGDHRATDGRTGAMFLDKLNKYLQQPKDLL